MNILIIKDDKVFKSSIKFNILGDLKESKLKIDSTKHIPIKKYLSKNFNKIKHLLKDIEYDKILAIRESDESDFENIWWLDFHRKCKRCIKECKQSHMVKEVRCKEYKKEKNT